MTEAKSTAARRRGGLVYFAVLAVMLAALSSCGDRKSAADYIKAAEAHLASGDIRAATVELKNALQKEPKNTTARVLLGQAYLDLSDASAAEVELQHARDDGAQPIATAKPLARAELMLRKPKEALALTEPVEGASPQLAASLLSFRAQAYFALGQGDEGDKAFAEGLKLDPHSVDVLVGMARAALVRHDLPQAKDRLAAAEKEAPKEPQVLELAGDVAFTGGDFAASEQSYQDLHTAQPWNLTARVGMARAQISESKLKEAIANLDTVLKSASKDPRANYLRALAAYLSKDMPAVQNYAQRALSAAPNYAAALLLSGSSSYAMKQYEAANNALGQYLHLVPQNLQARKLLAATQLQLNRPADAVQTLTPAMTQSGDDAQLLAMIGTASARSGDLAGANQYLEKAVEERPENAALRTELGLTQIALGNTTTGIEELEKAVQQNPKELRPELALVMTYMRNKEYDKAIEVAGRLQKNFPDSNVGLVVAGIAHVAKGEVDVGRAELLKVHDKEPGNVNADRNLAALAMAQNKPEEAHKYLEDIITANPKVGDNYIELAEFENRIGHPDEAEAALKRGLDISPDNLRLRFLLADFLLSKAKFQDAITTIQPGLTADPRNTAMLEIVGRAQLGLKQVDNAVATFKKLVDQEPQSSLRHQQLAIAYSDAAKGPEALDEARQAVTFDSNNTAAKFLLMRLLVAAGKPDEASTIVQELKPQYPKDLSLAEYEGVVAVQLKKPEDAVAAFGRAVSINDNGPDRRLLASAQSQAGRANEAEHTLKTWIDAHPQDAAAQIALGDTYLAANRLDEAATQYSEALHAAPANAIAENNLAWVLMKQGKGADALDHAHKAVKLAPESAEVMDTLGLILLQTGSSAEAASNLQKASEKAPSDRTIKFHFAQALANTGQKDGARFVLNQLLSDKQLFKERDEAEKLLTQLSGG
jgi:putative PEP-CTERM system TPR-repeat lipoprotein